MAEHLAALLKKWPPVVVSSTGRCNAKQCCQTVQREAEKNARL